MIKKVISIIIVVAVISILVLVQQGWILLPVGETATGNYYSGDKPSDIINEPITSLGFSNYDIHLVIVFVTGKSLPFDEHEKYIEGLHMTMWGLNGRSASLCMQDYDRSYPSDGYNEISSTTSSGLGWEAYTKVWQRGLSVRGVTTSDGSTIKVMYGYDTIIMTNWGSVSEYLDYANFLASY